MTTYWDNSAFGIHQVVSSSDFVKDQSMVIAEVKPLKATVKANCHPKISQDDFTCGACLMEMEHTDRIGTIKCCPHRFHSECILKWAEQENSCPQCKKRFTHVAVYAPGAPLFCEEAPSSHSRGTGKLAKRSSISPTSSSDTGSSPSEFESKEFVDASGVRRARLGLEQVAQVFDRDQDFGEDDDERRRRGAARRAELENNPTEAVLSQVICRHCRSGENEDELLLCDHCDDAYHMSCVGLSYLPDGDWFCPNCIKKPDYRGDGGVVSPAAGSSFSRAAHQPARRDISPGPASVDGRPSGAASASSAAAAAPSSSSSAAPAGSSTGHRPTASVTPGACASRSGPSGARATGEVLDLANEDSDDDAQLFGSDSSTSSAIAAPAGSKRPRPTDARAPAGAMRREPDSKRVKLEPSAAASSTVFRTLRNESSIAPSSPSLGAAPSTSRNAGHHVKPVKQEPPTRPEKAGAVSEKVRSDEPAAAAEAAPEIPEWVVVERAGAVGDQLRTQPSLYLAGQQMTDDVASVICDVKLARVVEKHRTTLWKGGAPQRFHTVDLRNNELTDSGMMRFLRVTRPDAAISLARNRLDDTFALKFAEYLESWRSLPSLTPRHQLSINLSGNRITDNGVWAIIDLGQPAWVDVSDNALENVEDLLDKIENAYPGAVCLAEDPDQCRSSRHNCGARFHLPRIMQQAKLRLRSGSDLAVAPKVSVAGSANGISTGANRAAPTLASSVNDKINLRIERAMRRQQLQREGAASMKTTADGVTLPRDEVAKVRTDRMSMDALKRNKIQYLIVSEDSGKDRPSHQGNVGAPNATQLQPEWARTGSGLYSDFVGNSARGVSPSKQPSDETRLAVSSTKVDDDAAHFEKSAEERQAAIDRELERRKAVAAQTRRKDTLALFVPRRTGSVSTLGAGTGADEDNSFLGIVYDGAGAKSADSVVVHKGVGQVTEPLPEEECDRFLYGESWRPRPYKIIRCVDPTARDVLSSDGNRLPAWSAAPSAASKPSAGAALVLRGNAGAGASSSTEANAVSSRNAGAVDSAWIKNLGRQKRNPMQNMPDHVCREPSPPRFGGSAFQTGSLAGRGIAGTAPGGLRGGPATVGQRHGAAPLSSRLPGAAAATSAARGHTGSSRSAPLSSLAPVRPGITAGNSAQVPRGAAGTQQRTSTIAAPVDPTPSVSVEKLISTHFIRDGYGAILKRLKSQFRIPASEPQPLAREVDIWLNGQTGNEGKDEKTAQRRQVAVRDYLKHLDQVIVWECLITGYRPMSEAPPVRPELDTSALDQFKRFSVKWNEARADEEAADDRRRAENRRKRDEEEKVRRRERAKERERKERDKRATLPL